MQPSGLELLWRVTGKGLEKLFQEFSLFIWDLHLCQGSHPAFGCLWSCWSRSKPSPMDWQARLALACPCPHHHGADRPSRVRVPRFSSPGMILTPTRRHIPQPTPQPIPRDVPNDGGWDWGCPSGPQLPCSWLPCPALMDHRRPRATLDPRLLCWSLFTKTQSYTMLQISAIKRYFFLKGTMQLK